jgi:O-glycosyl hydrolase
MIDGSTSKMAFKNFYSLMVGLMLLPSFVAAESATANVTLVVDPGIRHQTMDNFGANDAWYLQRIASWSDRNKNRLADLLFSTNDGIGLSCWRFYVGAGINTNTIRNRSRTLESFAVAPGKYNWSREAGQRWFLRAAKARGVRQFIASLYSPPPWLTRNGLSNLGDDTNSTTNLKPGAEDAFARYITDILLHFRDDPDQRERVEFDYVLPVNEPQWSWQRGQEGNRASNTDLKRIYAALAKRLKQTGLKTKILGPESGSIPDMSGYDTAAREQWHADYGDYLQLICADPEVSAGFGGVISYHSYWSDEIRGQLVPDRERLGEAMARYPGWKIWESEYCVMERGRDLTMDTALRVARVIHCDLTLANASAWQWWLAVANEDYKSGLIYTDYRKPGDAENILESKTLWVLGNYSRFIRPGMVRVEIQGDQPGDIQGLLPSAYLNPENGEIVMVFVNMSDQPQRVKLELAGQEIKFDMSRRFTPYITSAQDNLRESQPVEVRNGVLLPGRSVVTLVSN